MSTGPRRTLLALALLLVSAGSASAGTGNNALKSLSISTGLGDAADALRLRGPDARQQLVVTGTEAAGVARDVTRDVRYAAAPANVVRVDDKGLVTAVGNGSASVTVRTADGLAAALSVTVEQFESPAPINFANRVVPVFTKAGCNAGACHGKLSGQNGFRLSLLGFEPSEDYDHLVKEARGRRLFPAAPDRSLVLQKASGQIPHGGGRRIEPDSDDYRTVARWIGQGMPYGRPDDPTVAAIEVYPPKRVMSRGGAQQLIVTAHYTDGSTEDVSRAALYEPNDSEMARVDAAGHVEVMQQPGDVAVMLRYQGKVAVFRATIPLGAPVDKLPPARNFVDELVFKKLKEIGLPPSAVCSDATFVRRVTLDVAGRLPTPDEAQRFLADADPHKRDKLIDALLASSDYADYFANKWSALLRNKRSQPGYARGTFAFHDWVRDGFAANKPYDQFVREIVTASGEVDANPPVAWYRQVKETGDQLEDTAQLFLGMRLKCAQCHHHPFEKWSQQDYFGFAAFFSRVGRRPTGVQGEDVIFHKRGLASATNPRTKSSVRPAGLGTAAVEVSADDDPRQALAGWMTRPENPFFARSLANRYWKHFLGRGLVEPEDDMRETNPPTNPDLLDALAKHFAAHGFDLKDLVRTICRSTTYQLDSGPNEFNRIDKQNYSRFYPKRLTAEVLLDAVDQVAGAASRFDGLPPGTRAVQLPDNSYNTGSYFLTVFGRPESSSACECERSQEPSLAQSLHLLNAKDVQDKVGDADRRAARLAADKDRSDEEKVRELYHWAFSRDPDASEMATAKGHIARATARGPEAPAAAGNAKGDKGDRAGKARAQDGAARYRQAYEDLVWAIVNTKEFSFNH